MAKKSEIIVRDVAIKAGLNAFTFSPTRWITATNAIGIISQAGRNGGTYASLNRRKA